MQGEINALIGMHILRLSSSYHQVVLILYESVALGQSKVVNLILGDFWGDLRSPESLPIKQMSQLQSNIPLSKENMQSFHQISNGFVANKRVIISNLETLDLFSCSINIMFQFDIILSSQRDLACYFNQREPIFEDQQAKEGTIIEVVLSKLIFLQTL